MSAVQVYQEAFRRCDEAKKAVARKTKAVSDIASAMNYHLRSFLGFNFGIQIDNARERYDRAGKVDVSEWPSADELKSLFTEWNEADTALRSAWSAIPEPDRAGLTAPPKDMRL